MSTFKISLEDAVEYISAYRNQLIHIENPVVPSVIGGTVHTDLIFKHMQIWKEMHSQLPNQKHKEVDELYEGLAAWSCWKKKDQHIESPEFTLAFEINDGIILNERRQYPDFPFLAWPFDTLDDTDSQISTLDLLQNPPLYSSPMQSVVIPRGNRQDDGDSVVGLLSTFMTDGPANAQGQKYNEYPFGIFENKTTGNEVDQFFDQPGIKYFRYYFGFDPNATVNKIRIILIAAKEDGTNIIPDRSQNNVQDEEIILQTSWPPKIGG